jgi:hypothetical protein
MPQTDQNHPAMIKKILPFLALAFVLLVSWQISQQRSLSMHFVDEDDHIAGGNLINRGYLIHHQLQSNHQPLVYLASAAIQKTFRPNNLFMLIKRHRQAVFAYGALWSLILVWRFGWTGLIFGLFFEFLKYGLLGNLLLMESLAVYPAVYLLAATLTPITSRAEFIWLGISAFLVIFNLVPLYPWLGIILLSLTIKHKKRIFWLMFGLLIPTLLLFWRYSPLDWFRETIYHNWVYAAPALNQVKTTADWLKILFFPFTAYFTTNSLQARFIAWFFSGYLIAGWFNRKLFWLYPLLVLANNRVLSPGAAYYEGFHLLPWLGLLIWIFVFSLRFLPKQLTWILSILSLALLVNPAMPYFNKTDPNYEYYVNYSPIDDVNFAVKKLAWPGDRLAVTANQPLVYWQTNTIPATREFVYYAWQHQVPELKTNYEQVMFGDNPPEIIYGNKDKNVLADKYINILKYGQPTALFIRADRLSQITTSQWEVLANRGFKPSSAND